MSSEYQKKDNSQRPASESEALCAAMQRAVAKQERMDKQVADAHERVHQRINSMANRGAAKSRKS